MIYPQRAEPLTDEEFADFVEAGWDDALIILDGVLYSDEDLHRCDCCEVRVVDRAELDEEDFCEDCAVEAQEEAEHQRYLRRWYQSAVL